MAVYEYDSQNDELKRVAGGTLYADCPIGSYIPFGGTVIPTGWLLCNGQAVSRTDYADLFAVIGTAYGSGDGSTTFNIPDLRESVPKGAGLTGLSNNHLDADGLAVGEFIDDRIQEHTHNVGAAASGGTAKFGFASKNAQVLSYEEQTSSNTGRTGATTEVKSVGSNYIIKAKQIGAPADFVDAIDNVIEERFSYSTTEKNTGRKWIDGKDIYSIVLVQSGQITTNTAYFATEISNLNIDTITLKFAKAKVLSGGTVIRNNMTEYYANASDYFSVSANEISAIPLFSGNILGDLEVTLEYTKS